MVDFAILADLMILLLVLVLPLVSRGVERNLEAFLFVMGALAAWAAGALPAPLIRDAVTHPIPITAAVFTSGLLFKWARPHIGDALVRLRLVAPLPVLLAVDRAVGARDTAGVTRSPAAVALSSFH